MQVAAVSVYGRCGPDGGLGYSNTVTSTAEPDASCLGTCPRSVWKMLGTRRDGQQQVSRTAPILPLNARANVPPEPSMRSSNPFCFTQKGANDPAPIKRQCAICAFTPRPFIMIALKR